MTSGRQPTVNSNPNLTLDKVCTHFENWRTRRPGKAAIPGKLWAEAVALCHHHPISTVAKSLRLNRGDLKKRFESAAAVSANIDFVEVSLPQELPVQYTLEIGRQNENYIRAHIQGRPSELIAQIITLWRAVA